MLSPSSTGTFTFLAAPKVELEAAPREPAGEGEPVAAPLRALRPVDVLASVVPGPLLGVGEDLVRLGDLLEARLGRSLVRLPVPGAGEGRCGGL